MLRSAKIAALARDGHRFGVRIPEVEVDFKAVRQRSATSSSPSRARARNRSNAWGVRVFLEEARLLGEHRVELADGTPIEADKVVLTTGTEAAAPPIPGLADGPFWTNREADLGDRTRPPARSP